MMRVAVGALAALALMTQTAYAGPTPVEGCPTDTTFPLPDGHLRLLTGPGVLLAPNGLSYLLPQGTHILSPEEWHLLDNEVIRLQDQEIRLTEENQVLRDAVMDTPWVTVGTLLLVGLAGGYALNRWL